MTKDSGSVDPAAQDAPPIFREVVGEHGDPTPDMRRRPPTYEEIRQRVDRRPVPPPADGH